MLGYISLGTNNMAKATAFYDALSGLVGAKRVWDDENFVAWSNAPTGLRGGDDSTFYAAYFRDPDGNKLNAFYMGPA